MQDSREKAIAILKNKDKTEFEMRSALEKNGYSAEEIDGTIEYLVELSYIDDVAYTVNFVEMSMEKRRGPIRITRELAAKGIEDGVIRDCISDIMCDQWEWETARAIAEDIRRKNPSVTGDKVLARIVNKLTYEGFSDDVVSEIAEDLYSNDS